MSEFLLIYQDGAKCLCIITDEGHGYRSLQRLQYSDPMASWYWFGRQSKPLNSSFFIMPSHLWDMQQKVNAYVIISIILYIDFRLNICLVSGSVIFLHQGNYLPDGNIVQ